MARAGKDSKAAATLPKLKSVGKIFISYRREDSAPITERMYDWLALRVPNEDIFIDIDSVDYGANFVQRIQETIPRCKAALVVIGPQWLGKDGSPSTYVRMEVEMALSKGIHIIPVLVDGATMPQAQQLPEAMRTLVYLNAATVRTVGRDFQRDMEDLGKSLGIPLAIRGGIFGLRLNLRPRHPWILAGATIALLALISGAAVLLSANPNGDPTSVGESYSVILLLISLICFVIITPASTIAYLVSSLRGREWLWVMIAPLSLIPGILLLAIANLPVQGVLALLGCPLIFLFGYGWLGSVRNMSRLAALLLIFAAVSASLYSITNLPKTLLSDPPLSSPADGWTTSLQDLKQVTLSYVEFDWGDATVDRDHVAPDSYTFELHYCRSNCLRSITQQWELLNSATVPWTRYGYNRHDVLLTTVEIAGSWAWTVKSSKASFSVTYPTSHAWYYFTVTP